VRLQALAVSPDSPALACMTSQLDGVDDVDDAIAELRSTTGAFPVPIHAHTAWVTHMAMTASVG
jgi:hypothetical protein